ncbi:MAG: hypothetical protein ABH877_00665 [bacterium]
MEWTLGQVAGFLGAGRNGRRVCIERLDNTGDRRPNPENPDLQAPPFREGQRRIWVWARQKCGWVWTYAGTLRGAIQSMDDYWDEEDWGVRPDEPPAWIHGGKMEAMS